MPNTNCLRGWCCPKCGNTAQFEVAATCLVTLTDDGTDTPMDFTWEPTAFAQCSDCGLQATVAHFERIPED
jgi:hypothetical protein